MRRCVRALGIALLAVIVANPLAAVCLCHQPHNPHARQHQCCDGDAHSDRTLQAVAACCQTERAERDATTLDAPEVTTTAVTCTPVDTTAGRVTASSLRLHAHATPPLVTVLRA
jgi:hypothetical protein